MSNKVILLELTLLVFTISSISGCDDGSSDSDTGGDTDTDTDTDTDSDTDEGPGSLAGDYECIYAGDEGGYMEMTIHEDGTFDVVVFSDGPGMGEQISASGKIDQDGQTSFSVSGTFSDQSVNINYNGGFRFEEKNVFGWGDWSSDSGGSGIWGAWRITNDLDLDETQMNTSCEAIVAECNDSENPIDVPECVHQSEGLINYAAAKSNDCMEIFRDFVYDLPAFLEANSECPGWISSEFGSGWSSNDCPPMPWE